MKKMSYIVISITLSFVFLTGCNLMEKRTVEISGNAMSPTLNDKDRVVVDKGYYKNNDVKRGEVIIYKYEDAMYPKRVFGLPGELIQWKNGEWLADGKPINKEFIFEEIPEDENLAKGITLGEDEYYVVGDSPRISKDSRYIGPIKRINIIGKVLIEK